ncbi:DUF4249 domain-containing protein [Bacteroides sp. 214]|uniref:DUF4249 domain-containing protein n=1 Tax=Bacteroides sp. 214 TaxID=2302935 RepID=UPI0013D0FDB0|nr:DUF4249 domain-containing protein [Bacteroides sp. 214]NDW12910.1 DUF4249 domain-containing protein [Bacteroides sp. 214]
MDIKKLIIGCIGALVLISCERIIDFEGDKSLQGITINGLATTDTVFVAAISRAYLFTDVPPITYLDYWEYEIHPDTFYRNQTVLPNANVELTVNGADKYMMRYDPLHYNYRSDYIPRTGDRLTLRVEAEELETVTAETTVPSIQRLEVLDYETYYEKKILSNPLWDSGLDTVARITLRLTDPGNERNYYRLKVRNIGYDESVNGEILMFSDIYTSADVIFMDNRLTKSYGGWAAYFSNVFDDNLFNGKEYTFSVETRLRYGERKHCVIELQSITSDFYHYLKSVMLYRITDQDAYTESIQIHSNVKDGWGILGAIGTEKHIVPFD